MSRYDCFETERAVNAYMRYPRGREIPQQPCRHSSSREGNLITLRNVSGDLACYRIQPSGRLVRLG